MQHVNISLKVGLLELLYRSQGTQYVIPAYHCNYTWVANREVKQLLDDIKIVLSGEILQKEHRKLSDIEDCTQQLIAEIARLNPYFEANDSFVNKVPICIDYKNAYTQGYYYSDNGSVEVLEYSNLYMDLPSP